MSLYEYRVSRDLERDDVPFYGLIMAAMRRADTLNLGILKRHWPHVYEELRLRYDAPRGGLLPGEKEEGGEGWSRKEDGTLVDAEGVEIFYPNDSRGEVHG